MSEEVARTEQLVNRREEAMENKQTKETQSGAKEDHETSDIAVMKNRPVADLEEAGRSRSIQGETTE